MQQQLTRRVRVGDRFVIVAPDGRATVEIEFGRDGGGAPILCVRTLAGGFIECVPRAPQLTMAVDPK